MAARRAFQNDREKDLFYRDARFDVLRFTREHVVDEPTRVLVRVVRELTRRAASDQRSRSRRSVSSSLARRSSAARPVVSRARGASAALECILIVSSTSAGLTRPNGTAGGSSGTTRSSNSAAETRRRGRGAAAVARRGRHGAVGGDGAGPGGHGAGLGGHGAGRRRRWSAACAAFAGAVGRRSPWLPAGRLTAPARTAFFLQTAWVCAPRGAGAPRALRGVSGRVAAALDPAGAWSSPGSGGSGRWAARMREPA